MDYKQIERALREELFKGGIISSGQMEAISVVEMSEADVAAAVKKGEHASRCTCGLCQTSSRNVALALDEKLLTQRQIKCIQLVFMNLFGVPADKMQDVTDSQAGPGSVC